MLFASLVTVFERIEHQASRLEMIRELSALFDSVSPEESQIITYFSLGSLYPVFRPTVFNVAQKTLSPVLANFSGVVQEDWDCASEKLGDLGSVFELFWTSKESSGLTLVEVYAALIEFEAISGNGSKDKKNVFLLNLLSKCNGLEVKFIIRIILGVLRLGFSEMTIIDALSWMISQNKSHSPAIEAAFNVCADIGFVTLQLKLYGIEGISHLLITPGVPVRPAAAERMNSPKDIFDKLGACYSQPKLDGFRLQVHKYVDENGVTQVKFFSRNLHEKSDVFPELSASVRALDAQSFIAEGEAITYDLNTGIFLPFQETAKRGRKHLNQSVIDDFPLKLFLFDVLYLNGENLLSVTHKQRRKILVSFVASSDGIITAIGETRCDSAQAVDHSFMQALAEGLEGVVIKKGDTPYTPGKRNFNWIKLKRKETGELSDTLDCVILGYYWGKGHRSALGIGAVLLGVYNDETDMFESIARCGSGPTEEEWKSLKAQCDEHKLSDRPSDVATAQEHAPDVWVEPRVVVAIRADELTRSPLHRAGKIADAPGYALRFPRIMEHRFDKSARDSTTVKEVVRLYELQF